MAPSSRKQFFKKIILYLTIIEMNLSEYINNKLMICEPISIKTEFVFSFVC